MQTGSDQRPFSPLNSPNNNDTNNSTNFNEENVSSEDNKSEDDLLQTFSPIIRPVSQLQQRFIHIWYLYINMHLYYYHFIILSTQHTTSHILRRLAVASAVKIDGKFSNFTTRPCTSSALLIPIRTVSAPLLGTEEEHSINRVLTLSESGVVKYAHWYL